MVFKMLNASLYEFEWTFAFYGYYILKFLLSFIIYDYNHFVE